MQKDSPSKLWPWLMRIAFALAIVIVISRSQILEFLRDPFEVNPGDKAIPRGPGPSTSLVLDLLATLPALIVAARAALDRTFQLRKSWGNLVMLLLALWLVIGGYRSDDRFAGINDAAHACAALSLLWAMQQMVRSWRHLRLVAAFSFGILMVYLPHGVIDKFVELPARQHYWDDNAGDMLKNMNIEPGSFQAEQMKKKIGSGELLGFGASINTFGAVLATLGVVAAGAALHCGLRGKEPGVAALIAIVLGCTFVVIYWTDSRTALATPFLAAIALGAMVTVGPMLRRYHRALYVLGVLCVIAGTVAIIVIGNKTGGLLQDSMNFRWRYWLGAYHVWLEHPIAGVGWDSFQFRYLAHRLPIASEEVKDPHNFIVRAFVELGLIGGILTLLWVGRGLWDMTRPAHLGATGWPYSADLFEPHDTGLGVPRTVPPEPETSNDLTKIALVCIAGVLLAFLAATDWDRVDWNVAMDALKRLLFVCVLTVGCAVVALKSLKEQVVDDRPAEWIRGAMTIAVMIFLVHNLIDFSMFETSAMFIAAMLAGTTWGAGLPEKSEPRGVSFARLGVGVVAFIAAFAAWVVPTILAESAAGTADDLLRNQRFAEAARLYYSAWQTWPANADYPYRAARAAAIMGSTDDAELEQLLTAAIDDNPHNVKYYLMRAQWEQRRASPRIDRIRADYDRVLAIDPNNIAAHLEYAEVLRHFNQPVAAVEQLEAALRYNDGLDPHDPRRLPADRVAAIDQTLRTLKR